MTQALIPDSLAYSVTLSKSLHYSGLIFLCRMKNRLKIPCGISSHHADQHVSGLAPPPVMLLLRSCMV